MSTYNEFAFIYDDLMKKDFDYKNWFVYIEEVFKKEEIKPKKILEMASGTGNLSEEIVKKDYNLTIFDISQEMLSIADEKLNKYKNIRILKQDMINFNLNKRFDSIISVCDSINYILEFSDLVKTFKNVYNHLEENGLFIFDINSYYKLKEILANNIFIDENEEIFYTWENFYDYDTDICEFYLNFFVSKNGEIYTRFIEQHFEKAYTEEIIEKALYEAGFEDIKKYECFTFNEVKRDSERINYVVRK